MKLLLKIFFLLCVNLMHAQDSIVFYSGFEENVQPVYTTYHISEFNTKWFSAWNSPDIFSSFVDSNYSNTYSIPSNIVGFQYPLLGNSYAGITTIALGFATEYREWLGAKLNSPLVENNVYCIKINISLADSVEFSSNNLSVLFYEDSLFMPDVNSQPIYNIVSQISTVITSEIISDNANWNKYEIQYTAHGGEKYIYIGNFFSDSLTSYNFTGNGSLDYGIAYYYIDEVTVYKCDGVGIQENKPINIAFYPNPTTGDLYIVNPQDKTLQVEIISPLGQTVYKQQLVGGTNYLNMAGLANGMYLVRVVDRQALIAIQKLIINK